ncbi:MAG: hypothetical protein RLZZ262_888 [Bacteroidota bacterium]|jgi:phage shock protein PspC (stress-responsive transcriptional regulator)
MNRTISINLGGSVFNIEELAFDRLKSYLNEIKSNLEEPELVEEVMTDIELRIAELFKERMSAVKNVVIPEDVEYIVQVMGRPEDYGSGNKQQTSDAKGHHREGQRNETSRNKNRRVFRDSEDAIIGGVCSGLSHYFGWDPIILRIFGVLIGLVSFGTAALGYMIIWALIPEARTTPEKLQMRGEPVNIENISRFVNEEAAKASQNINKASRKFSASTTKAVQGAGSVLGKLIGLLLCLIGLGLLFGLMAALTAADAEAFGYSYDFFSTRIWDDPSMGWWIMLSIVLVLGAPALGMLYLGLRLIINASKRIPFLGASLIGLFIVGVVLAFWCGTRVVSEFSRHAEFKTELTLPQQEVGDTLYLKAIPNDYFKGRNENHRSITDLVKEVGDSIYYGEPIFMHFESTDEPNYKVRIIQNSEGKNLNEAGELANHVHYDYILRGNELSVATVFSTPLMDKYRGQNVQITLFIPQGKKVHIGQGLSWLSWIDEEDENKVFTMCNEGLKLKCRESEMDSDEKENEKDTISEDDI